MGARRLQSKGLPPRRRNNERAGAVSTLASVLVVAEPSVGQWANGSSGAHNLATASPQQTPGRPPWLGLMLRLKQSGIKEVSGGTMSSRRAGQARFLIGMAAMHFKLQSPAPRDSALPRNGTDQRSHPSCSIADSMQLAIATNALAIVTENLQAKQQAQERQQAEDKKAVLEWSAENQPRLAAAVPALQELSQSTPMFHPVPSGAKSDQGQDLTHKTHVCNLFT